MAQLTAIVDLIALPGGEFVTSGIAASVLVQIVPAQLGDAPVLVLVLEDIPSFLHLLEILGKVEGHLGRPRIPVGEHPDVLRTVRQSGEQMFLRCV